MKLNIELSREKMTSIVVIFSSAMLILACLLGAISTIFSDIDGEELAVPKETIVPDETEEPAYVPALTTENCDYALLPVTKLETREKGALAVASNVPSPSVIGGFAPDTSTTTIPVTVNGQLIDVGFCLNRYAHYNLTYATTEFPTIITLGQFDGYSVEVNGLALEQGESCSLQFTRLSHSQAVELKITELATGDIIYAYLNSLHSDFRGYQVSINNPEEGYYYFNDPSFAYKMDTKGELVFYRFDGGGFDFHRTEVDGEVYYSYIAASTPRKAIILNEKYELIEQIDTGIDYEDMIGIEVDTHDFQILGKNHYIYFCYFGQTPENTPEDLPYGPNFVTAIIQEVKDGDVVFHWDSSDHPEYYPIYNSEVAEKNLEYNLDYVHANSIFIDPKDNNLIVSFRNIDTVSKIDRITGEVIWNLGGMIDDFGLTEDQKFSYQHHATLNENGDLTLFNNDNGDGTTSVMRFRLDEENMCLLDFEEYIYTDGFAGFLGSAQWLGDEHLLVCWGGRSTPMPVFSEMNYETGEIFFELHRPSSYYSSSYRVYKDKY